jgi:hypothetical protein
VAESRVPTRQYAGSTGNPIAYGERLDGGDGAPTLLVYGHYDVQPADPFELWETPPFEPEIRDGRIYARGSTDNKGPLFVYLKALETILAVDGRLPCNVKVLVEGEEELRADHLDAFLAENRELLASDACVISDSALYGVGCRRSRSRCAGWPRCSSALKRPIPICTRGCTAASRRTLCTPWRGCSRRCTMRSGVSTSRVSTTPSGLLPPRRSPSGSGCCSTKTSCGRRSARRG